MSESQMRKYVILLSGTHSTGKETLAMFLSKSMGSPWLRGEMAHNIATFGARSQAKKGYDYGKVFGRIWSSKIRRIGFPPHGGQSDGQPEDKTPKPPARDCVAVITCYAMRKPARDAIRDVMLSNSINLIFIILHITKETLSGRTVGAEEPELAERILGEKAADIEEPLDEEKDVILIDSMHDVDTMFSEIQERIAQQLEA